MTNSFLRIALILCGIILSAMMIIGLFRIKIDTNILTSLPKSDPVIADANFTLMHHPYQNQVVIDVSGPQKDMDALVAAGEIIESELANSGLFKTVGTKHMQQLFPALMDHIANNLPVLFSEQELNEYVQPIFTETGIRQRLRDNLSQLLTMDSIGQTESIINDPLGIRGIILQKLKQLLPTENVHFYKGHLISSDRRHLLVIANPHSASIDATLSHKINALIEQIKITLNQTYEKNGTPLTITPVGAYRATIDNETAAKKDTQNAILYASLGIALLLIFSFPRPLIGLLAFLPAVFGTLCSLAVYSIWHPSISIMTIGFGGAIISITVDHGISYLLFSDRPHETKGRDVAREVRAVSFLAALTSVCAFLTLSISGFPIMSQIGQFAAFGIAFSFFFVHSCFPLLIPKMKPGKSMRTLSLQTFVNKLFIAGGKYKLLLSLSFAVLMCFFAKPEFKIDIASMNTVTKETLAAENMISTVWGHNIFDKVYMLVSADSIPELQNKSDQLTAQIMQDISAHRLSDAFLPSMIFPGDQRRLKNLTAWKQFWNENRKTLLNHELYVVARELGFSPDAFPDIYIPGDHSNAPMAIPPEFHQELGISLSQQDNAWILFASLTPGQFYHSEEFFNKYHENNSVHIFDPPFFSDKLGEFLSKTFFKMILIISASVFVILLLFFLDITLTFVALTPIIFSMICTLGMLHLLDRPLNIAGLMLSVVVIGMGLDYTLYLIRSYQRYRDESHPFQNHIRMTIFLAATSTLIGFGALSTGDHNLMRNLGFFLVLGIGFALIGSFALLPSILNHLFKPVTLPPAPGLLPNSEQHLKRVRRLYRHMDTYPRIFARFKIMLDPMFMEISRYLKNPKTLIDVGCGYGVPAAWLHGLYPDTVIYGIEPDMERVRIASQVVNANSRIEHGKAPDLPDFQGLADTVLMLDMLHYLTDAEVNRLLDNVLLKLDRPGKLIIRVMIPSPDNVSWFRKIEEMRLHARDVAYYFRPLADIKDTLTAKGFHVQTTAPSGAKREETWIIATLPPTWSG